MSLPAFVSVEVVDAVAEAEMLAGGASATFTTIAFVTDSPLSRSDGVRSQTTAVPAEFSAQPVGAETNVVPDGIGIVTRGASGRPGPLFVTVAVSVRFWPGSAVPGFAETVVARSTLWMTDTDVVAVSFVAFVSVDVVDVVAERAMDGPGSGPTLTTIAVVSDSPRSRPEAVRSQTTAVPRPLSAQPVGAETSVVPAGSGIVTLGSTGRAAPVFVTTAVSVRFWPGRTGSGPAESDTPRSTVWSTGTVSGAESFARFVSVEVVATVAEAAMLAPGVSPTRSRTERVRDAPAPRSDPERSQTTAVPAELSAHPVGPETNVVPAGTGIVSDGASGRPGPLFVTVAVSVRF